LEQFHATLPNNAEELDFCEVSAVVSKEQLEKDLKLLKNSKQGLRRPGWIALQHVVKSARDAPSQQFLLELGVVGVLTKRLHMGEQVERNLAFTGLNFLEVISPNAAKVVAVVRDLETLRSCTIIRKDPEIKALLALKKVMAEELKTSKTNEELEAKIMEKEQEMTALRKSLRESKVKKSGRTIALEPLSSSEEDVAYLFERHSRKRSRTDFAKQRRRQKAEHAESRQRMEDSLELQRDRCKAELADLQTLLSNCEPKLQLLQSQGMCKVLTDAVKTSLARRAGVAEARKYFLELFNLLEKAEDPSALGFSAFAADVATIRKGKLAYSKPLSHDLASRFYQRGEEFHVMAMKLGVVDDLVTIATGPKANAACVEILCNFHMDDKAKKLIDRYHIAKTETEADIEAETADDLFGLEAVPPEKVVERALSKLQIQRTRTKRTIKDVEAGDA